MNVIDPNVHPKFGYEKPKALCRNACYVLYNLSVVGYGIRFLRSDFIN